MNESDGYMEIPAEQEMDIPSSLPYPMPYNEEANIIKQTDPKHIIEELKHVLRGEEFDEEKQAWVKVRKPLLNEKGIRSIMTDIKGVVNQNTILSNLNEQEISNIIVNLGDTLRIKLSANRKEFDINKFELNTILFTILNMSYPALKRAYAQGERIWHKTISSEQRHVVISPEESKKRSGGFFKLFRK